MKNFFITALGLFWGGAVCGSCRRKDYPDFNG